MNALLESPADEGRLLQFARHLVRLAPLDPESWLALGYAYEARAWTLEGMLRWPDTPWLGIHREVQQLLAHHRGDADAPLPFRDDLSPFTGQPMLPKDADAFDIKLGPEWLRHKHWQDQLESGWLDVEMMDAVREVRRSRGGSASFVGHNEKSSFGKEILHPRRRRHLQQAMESYTRAAEFYHDAHSQEFAKVVRRFKQLMPYWRHGRQTCRTLIDRLLDALDDNGFSQEELEALRLEVLCEPFSRQFLLDGPLDDTPWLYVKLDRHQAAALADQAWAAFLAGVAILPPGSLGKQRPALPPELAGLGQVERSWPAIPPGRREGLLRLANVLQILSLAEGSRGKLADALMAARSVRAFCPVRNYPFFEAPLLRGLVSRGFLQSPSPEDKDVEGIFGESLRPSPESLPVNQKVMTTYRRFVYGR